MIEHFSFFFKGIAMGVANVIPGVSGGTIALITGVFERLINSIKAFDLEAANFLLRFKFKKFIEKVDLFFLLSLFLGAVVGVLLFSKILEFLFVAYSVYVWALFFGLILSSVFFVIKTISQWNVGVVLSLFVGLLISVSISVMAPMAENAGFFYLVLCGVFAICSMILPGLSGSFILVLMGNYQLIVIDAINDFDLKILLPVAIGAVVGLIVFSHFLSLIFKKFRNQTVSALSGFITGSLLILWPWKMEIYKLDGGQYVLKKSGEKILEGYNWYFPQINAESLMAFGLIIVGIMAIFLIEKFSYTKN